MASEPVISVIDSMDEILATYYKSFNKKYYVNEDGIGKFKQYCNDNGFEDTVIAEELQVDPEECMLIEFDMDENENNVFPLKINFDTEKQKQEAIFNILKYIYENKKPPLETILSTLTGKLKIDLYIKENVADEIIDKIYKKQLTCLGQKGANEPDLMYFFAVGYANKIPFLTWMVDAFTLDRSSVYVESDQKTDALTLNEWALQNRFMIELTATDSLKANQLKAAMSAYNNRLISRIHYNPTTRIDDSLESIVDMITAVPPLIDFMMTDKTKQGLHAAPFQVDVLFAVNNVKQDGILKLSPPCTPHDFDDDSDDDKNDSINPNVDYIGNIQQKLKANHCQYLTKKISLEILENVGGNGTSTRIYGNQKYFDNDKYLEYLAGYSRFLGQTYQEFMQQLRYCKRKKEDKHQTDAKAFPYHHRFGIFVDRRPDAVDIDAQETEVTFFEQSALCDTIPNEAVAEWCMESAIQCLIPGIEDEKTDKKLKTIKATDHICGQLLTFSFNVETNNEMQCYMIWNGQTMRFQGDNLGKILSYLFTDKQTKTTELRIKEELRFMNDQVKDKKFVSFCKKINKGYEQVSIDDL